MGKNKIHLKAILLSGVLLKSIILSSTVAFGSVIRVPGDYSTIQAAIDAASDGDIVTVSDGTYVGPGNKDLDFKGKAITVKSENGPANTIIDCQGDGRGFYFHTHETESSVLSGFTITNGRADYGGAIRCSSSPTIDNCRFVANTAERSGGGVFFAVWSSTVTNCTIIGNMATWGGGIYISSAATRLTNCTITGNTATSQGGIAYINDSPATITNCILWGGSVAVVIGINWYTPQFEYCDIQGDEITGPTIIHLDPLFVNVSDPSPLNWDLHLRSSSPCIDAGTNDAPGLPDTDFEGDPRVIDGDNDGDAVVDMGADEYVASAAPAATVYVESGGSCGGKSPCFDTIGEGVGVVTHGGTVNVSEGSFNEDITLDEAKELILLCGWDPTFTSVVSSTTVSSLVVRLGKIIPFNLVLGSADQPGVER